MATRQRQWSEAEGLPVCAAEHFAYSEAAACWMLGQVPMTAMQQQRERREQLQRERDREASFQHTQLGVYLAGAFGLMYLWASSAQVGHAAT